VKRPEVLLFLGPDAAGDVVQGLLEAATDRVDAAFYEIGPGYALELLKLARTGVRVAVVVDDHPGANSAAAGVLDAAPGALRVTGGRRGQLMHSKLAVLGGAAGSPVLVMTGNLILRDAPHHNLRRPQGTPLAGTREWGVAVTGSTSLTTLARAAIAAAAVDARTPPKPWALVEAELAPPVGAPEPAVAPLRISLAEHRLALLAGEGRIGAALLAAIGAAGRRVEVTVPYVHAGSGRVATLLDALAAAAGRGCAVRLLLGADPAAEHGATAAELAGRGVEARVMDPLRSTTGHAKGLVADSTVILGSANWSAAGLDGNSEACIRLVDPDAAAYFAAALDRDWEVAAG
jgi:phosphatidylserine/phosphatidylglycerophosphate/cardiolipin synthase-like enzyme